MFRGRGQKDGGGGGMSSKSRHREACASGTVNSYYENRKRFKNRYVVFVIATVDRVISTPSL